MSQSSGARLSYIDVLKLCAAFLVVLLHVSALYVQVDARVLHPSGALAYVINALTRTAMPLFMMISGALLLRDSYQFDFKRKFSFIIKTYIVWSAIYALVAQGLRWLSGGEMLPFTAMLGEWLQGPYHFWYLQMLLGFYLLMPLLARIRGLRVINYAALLLFVLLYIYGPLLPYLPQSLQVVVDQIMLFGPSPELFFFLFGGCVQRMPLSRKLAGGAAAAVVLGLGLRLWQIFSAPQYGDVLAMQPWQSYSELLLAAGLFYLARYLCRQYQSGPRLTYLSNCTLRIYIVSALFIFGYQTFIQPGWDALCPWPTLSVLLWSCVVFGCSILTAHLLVRKDAYLRAHPLLRRREP